MARAGRRGRLGVPRMRRGPLLAPAALAGDARTRCAEVGVEIGLILAILVAAVQTVALGMGLASRHDDEDDRSRP